MIRATTSEEAGGMDVRAFAATDRGRVRKGNEDAHHRGTTLFAVADGLGGRRAGEVASKTAIDALAPFERARPDSLEAAGRTLAEGFAAANRAVMEKGASRADYAGMATTLTAALLQQDHLVVAHVGDSRAYLLREGEGLRQLTRDHTVVAQLVRQLRLSEEEAASHPFRSVLVTAVGLDADLEVDLLPPLALQPGDQVLICSDGLTDPVADRSIAEVLATRQDGDEACAALIEAANLAGGPDNVTVVLLRVDPDPD
jgi:serine/threonine protein phosphatase PrpC